MNRTPVMCAGRQSRDLSSVSGLLRQAGPEDCGLIRDFVCDLSPRTQYFRFFTTVSPPSSGLLSALCGGRGSADILLLTDRLGAIIGHGMAADETGNDGLAANIGLVIADRWQGNGLGTMLLSMLVGRAAARGVTSLILDVLPANDWMLGIIGRRWPDAPRERTQDAIVIRPSIGRPVQPIAKVPAVVGLCRRHSPSPQAA